MPRRVQLTARIEAFDTFWEGPEEVEKGYASFGQFYRANYLAHVRAPKHGRILVLSCGPGYFVNLLQEEGYTNILGLDSDPEKVGHAIQRSLPCQAGYAFDFLTETEETFDLIFCEQELNHLTKEEILDFLALCRSRLTPGGQLIVHVLNGANPLTGAEALAQNFDHFNTFTEYSLRQVLEHSGFQGVDVLPLNLYVFYRNPLNYIGLLATGTLSLLFRVGFVLYGKSNRIFTKKIAAVAQAPGSSGEA